MWTFLDDGFLSIVEFAPPANKYDKTLKKTVPASEDPVVKQLPADYHPADNKTLSSHLLVRARVKDDLNAIKTYDPDSIETEDPTADYQFRLTIRRSAVAQYLYDKAMGLDYWSHVKETIDKRAPKVAGGRYSALSQVWSACSRWQPIAPWGNTVSYGGYGTSSGTSYGTANAKNNKVAVSVWNKETGQWEKPEDQVVPKAGNHEFVGGSATTGDADPKAITAGEKASDAKSDSASTAEGWRSVVDEYDDEWDSDAWLNKQMSATDADNPWPTETLALGVDSETGLQIVGEATRATMEAQLKDIVTATGQKCDIPAVVDALEDSFGTCDIEKLQPDVLRTYMEDYESVSAILAGNTASG